MTPAGQSSQKESEGKQNAEAMVEDTRKCQCAERHELHRFKSVAHGNVVCNVPSQREGDAQRCSGEKQHGGENFLVEDVGLEVSDAFVCRQRERN